MTSIIQRRSLLLSHIAARFHHLSLSQPRAAALGRAQSLPRLHLGTPHLQMLPGCLPASLVEQEDLFTAASHQHLLSVSSQPRWLINHKHPASACVITTSVSHLFVSPDALSNYMLTNFFLIRIH